MEFKIINIKELDINPENIRKKKSEVQGLLESIKENGVKVPFEVTPTDNGRYLITDGNTRAALIAEAGLDIDIPCLIVEVKNRAFEIAEMLSINNLRENLTLRDTADAYKQLSFMGISADRIAKRTGQSEETVNKLVKIAEIKNDAAFSGQASIEELVKIAEIEEKDAKSAKMLLQKTGENNFDFEYQKAKRAIAVADFQKAWADEPWYEKVPNGGQGYRKIGGVTVDKKFYRFENWNKLDEAPYEDHEQIEALTDAEKFWLPESDGIGIYVKAEVEPDSPAPEVDAEMQQVYEEIDIRWFAHVDSLIAYCSKLKAPVKTLAEKVLYFWTTDGQVCQDPKTSTWIGDLLVGIIGSPTSPFTFDGQQINIDADMLARYGDICLVAGYEPSDDEKALYQ